MRVISENECVKWCRTKGLTLDGHHRPRPVFASRRSALVPAEAGARVALVSRELEGFRGSAEILVWLDEWGVFPSSERMHLFDRLRLSYGIEDPLGESPGHIFESGEFEDLSSVVTLAVLFLWDCYVLTPSGKPALWYSHDEVEYAII